VPGTGRLVGGTASPEREEAVETVPGWPVCDRFVLGGRIVRPGTRRRNVGRVLRNLWPLAIPPHGRKWQ
jgi:hypothetical protein